ncbi:MAG: 50S ribosomal protein L28 [Candidatus Kerfeldbacteria bacterium]|nr:50S ribosomal protein L28 [Candidatus Kerfeldbacteria bacterium]
MAKMCDVCGRGAMTAQNRSHSMRATKTRKYVNLQSLNVGGQRVKACTSCVKTAVKIRT